MTEPGRSDVTAIVLTTGERTTARALESVRRQTLQPAETIVVRDVRPFHRALYTGVSRVETPFFVQVDSDMVLDETCLERLRSAMASEVGIAVGQLRDPLLGTIAGVKIFRRACFDLAPFRDSVSTDVDFYWEIADHGWLTLHLLSYAVGSGRAMHTFGDHRPDFTPAYTYATYYLLGCRYFRRRELESFLWRLGRLRGSRHAMATVARFALCSGLFSDERRDVVKSSVALDRELLDGLAGLAPVPARQIEGAYGASDLCERFYTLGRELGHREDRLEARAWMAALGALPVDATWIAEVSLCRGFSSTQGSETAGSVFARLRELRR
jgi:hypothetical protein